MPAANKFDTIRKILEDSLGFAPGLDVETPYERLHDDHDGRGMGKIVVIFGPDGDAWVRTDSHQGPTLRFRAPLGGSHSPRTRNALVILAYAIMLDEKQFPDPRGPFPAQSE
jgi:hypothetical protein